MLDNKENSISSGLIKQPLRSFQTLRANSNFFKSEKFSLFYNENIPIYYNNLSDGKRIYGLGANKEFMIVDPKNIFIKEIIIKTNFYSKLFIELSNKDSEKIRIVFINIKKLLKKKNGSKFQSTFVIYEFDKNFKGEINKPISNIPINYEIDYQYKYLSTLINLSNNRFAMKGGKKIYIWEKNKDLNLVLLINETNDLSGEEGLLEIKDDLIIYGYENQNFLFIYDLLSKQKVNTLNYEIGNLINCHFLLIDNNNKCIVNGNEKICCFDINNFQIISLIDLSIIGYCFIDEKKILGISNYKEKNEIKNKLVVVDYEKNSYNEVENVLLKNIFNNTKNWHKVIILEDKYLVLINVTDDKNNFYFEYH